MSVVKQQSQKKFSLSTLLQDIVNVDAQWDREISGISADSRTLMKDNLFIAYVGEKHDGRKFIDEVLAKGAAAIISEADTKQPSISQREINQQMVPIFAVPKCKNKSV